MDGGFVSRRVDDRPVEPARGARGSFVLEGDGRHVVTYQATDAAGNQSPERTAVVRVDRTAPEAAFEAADKDHPRRVAVLAVDHASGVTGGTIEMRRSGDADWRELKTELVDGRHLVATLPDDRLPDGDYALRARIADAAGNEALVERRADGAPALVRLPVRRPTLIALERRSLSAPIRLRFGAPAVIRGVLRERGRGAVVGARIEVLSQLRTGGAVRSIGAVGTDRSGRFTVRVPAGASRTIRLAYDGDDTIRPTSLSVRLLVPARSTIAVTPRVVRNGRSVRFTGRLLGGHVPTGGRTLELQAYFRRSWRTFATPRADAHGRWRYAYRFGATVGTVVYRFRARIPREAAYPFELGSSPVVRVTVRGR
jgi:hypothetical protein